ncbi:hypothetical protein ZWY2020_038782 [Hordeum vulgare]|nr:hypothetical protein ZWY2020_038782 [Hordeum vulgare]
MGTTRVVFETDSQLLAEAMDTSRADASPYTAIIEDLKYQLKLWFTHWSVITCVRNVFCLRALGVWALWRAPGGEVACAADIAATLRLCSAPPPNHTFDVLQEDSTGCYWSPRRAAPI